MTLEQPPKQEFSENEQQLITLLREKGPQDPEVRAMFDEWCLEEEAGATAANTSRANIEVQLKRAKLYRAAGGNDSAWQTLGAVCEVAMYDESAKDLYEETMRISNEIEKDFDENAPRQD
ncbi:MAG: hypothetical protein WCF77_00605 [Minisyncoccia bacterium]|jgi:hypothetical protein